MNLICPVSTRQINEKAARINALIVMVLLLPILFTDYKWFIFILAADFFIRGFMERPHSPVAWIGRTLCQSLGLKFEMINAGPKIFAARVGFVFSSVIGIMVMFNLIIAVNIMTAILAVFAGLEAFFGFCAACRIYTVLVKIT